MIEYVEEHGVLPLEWKEVEIDLQDGLEEEDQVDGPKTFGGMLVTGSEGDGRGDVIRDEMFSLVRIEEGEHSSSVHGQI